MVNPPDQRGPVPLERLDYVDRPEWTVARQALGHQSRDDLAQMRVVDRAFDRNGAHVAGGVEVRIVGPHRSREVEGNRGDALPAAWGEADPACDPVAQIGDGVAGALGDQHLAGVADDRTRLEREDP